MRLVTWNVNSIRARQERVLRFLEEAKADVVCLQELKCEQAQLAEVGIERLGYEVAAFCQRTYNGVAILSKKPLQDVRIGIDDQEEAEQQARVVAATVDGIRVISVYVPNGQVVGSDKYDYKLRFFERLGAYLARHHSPSDLLAVCGDFNVAPEVRDVNRPEVWEPSTLFHPSSREALKKLERFGLQDAFRMHHEEAGLYSWWDYRLLGFPKNDGLRIDLVLVTASLATRVRGSRMVRDERKGKGASDHIPVIVDIAGSPSE